MVKLCSFSGILGHNYIRKKCWCQNKRNIKCIHACENFTDVCVGSWVQTLIPHGNSGWAGPLDLSSPAPGAHGSLYGWDCSGPFCSAAFVCEFPVVPVLLPQHCNDIMGNFFFFSHLARISIAVTTLLGQHSLAAEPWKHEVFTEKDFSGWLLELG